MTTGLILSTAAAALLVVLLWDCHRRGERFGPWHLGPVSLTPTGVRRAWMAALVFAFVAGLYGASLTSRTEVSRHPAGVAAATPALRTTTSLRLPFLLRTVEAERTADGTALATTTRETVQLPWAFLVGAVVYWYLGARRGRAPIAGEDPGSRSETQKGVER